MQYLSYLITFSIGLIVGLALTCAIVSSKSSEDYYRAIKDGDDSEI